MDKLIEKVISIKISLRSFYLLTFCNEKVYILNILDIIYYTNDI